jgi:hypothetical protein
VDSQYRSPPAIGIYHVRLLPAIPNGLPLEDMRLCTPVYFALSRAAARGAVKTALGRPALAQPRSCATRKRKGTKIGYFQLRQAEAGAIAIIRGGTTVFLGEQQRTVGYLRTTAFMMCWKKYAALMDIDVTSSAASVAPPHQKIRPALSRESPQFLNSCARVRVAVSGPLAHRTIVLTRNQAPPPLG